MTNKLKNIEKVDKLISKKMYLILLILLLLISIPALNRYGDYRIGKFADSINAYNDNVYKIERNFIVKIPVYRDYVKPSIENELMKYNLLMHGKKVVKHGVKALRNTKQINENIATGKLVSVDKGKSKKYYFHNVRKEYRFLSPYAKAGLERVASRFQEKLKERNIVNPNVKLAVSSVIRTVNYQKKIFGRKFVSLHSFGGCFDIFFEDFFVVLPEVKSNNPNEKKLLLKQRRRLGFLMGDSLRRQFRSVLSETLLELQRKGLIYVFLENDNRCYHITIVR